MIPMAPGFFKPKAGGIWSEPFDSLPSLTKIDGTYEPLTPVLSGGGMQYIAASGFLVVSYFDGSPTVSDFDLSFSLQVSTSVNAMETRLIYRTPGITSTTSTGHKYSLGVNRAGAVTLYKSGVSIGSASVTAGSANNYQLVVDGSSHEVYINSSLQIDVTDASFSDASKIAIWNESNVSASGRVSIIDSIYMVY